MGYEKCFWSGSRVAPEMKFMFIWHNVTYMASTLEWLYICYEVAPELLRKSSLCSYMAPCGYITSAPEWGIRRAPEIKFMFIYDTM